MPIVGISQIQEGDTVVPVLSLKEYFSQNFTLTIPPWQREYTWDSTKDDGEVVVLMNDLKEFVLDINKKEYLLGAVILCNTDKSDISYLIDGQQRTVTLTLLLMCCNQYLIESKLFNANDFQLRTKLENTINADDHDYAPRVLFSQDNANIIFTQIYDWMTAKSEARDKFIQETETYSKTQNNLLAVVNYMSKALREGDWFDGEQLKLAIEKILDGVKMIQLRLDSKREAIQVYDRINHRGMQLSDADLIKNQLFERVSETEFDLISESWQSMVATLRESKSTKFQDPKYLIRAHAWTFWPNKTGYDELADKYVDEYLGKVQEPYSFTLELEELASNLVNFIKYSKSDFGKLPFLVPAQHLGSIQHFPVLLASKDLPDHVTFKRLYEQVAARSALYVFSKERPPEFESVIPRWAHAIRQVGKSATVEKLDEIYFENAFGDESSRDKKIQILGENLEAQVRGWRASNSADKKKIRAALALMSWWMDAQLDSEKDIESYFSTRKKKGTNGWDIEHIAARKYDNPSIDTDLRESIGNLALLCPDDQRPAQNDAPEDKERIYELSKLFLSQTVTGLNLTPRMNKVTDALYEKLDIQPNWKISKWSNDSINARTDFYVAFVKSLLTLKLDIPKSKS